MKLRDLNEDIMNLKNLHLLSNENKKNLRDTLASMYDRLERFEKIGKIETKTEREKVVLLKDFIFNLIKDEDEKRIIRGGWGGNNIRHEWRIF